MIRLGRNRAGIPAKYRGEKLVDLMVRLLQAWYESDGKVPFNTQKPRLQVWKEAKPNLRQEATDKCAYCESPTAVVAHGDVEHFRPKDIYWWLAFSYDNYTYSCQICNQGYKGAHFPISGTRIKPPVRLPGQRPNDLKLAQLAAQLCHDPTQDNDEALRALFGAELADLPHPYLDQPEDLFAWQADDINREVRLIPATDENRNGKIVREAERVLGLNREELRRARYGQYQLIYAHCLVLQAAPADAVASLALEALQRAREMTQPYAGMTRYFLRQWGVLDA